MRTIAICNLKGGVAKTTTAINTAAILAAQREQNVLVVDADSQCNCTEFLQRDKVHPRTLSDVLRYTGADAGAYALDAIEHSRYAGIDILCADDSLMDLDLSKVEAGSASASCLRELAAHMAAHPGGRPYSYDWMIIDCPPAFNAASAAALVAADEVVIPIKLDAFSLRGMANIMQQIRNMQRINPKLRVAGILPTMWYRSDNIVRAERELRAAGLPVFPHIRRTPKADDMTFAQEPLIVCSPKSAAAIDYRRFVEMLAPFAAASAAAESEPLKGAC